MKKILGILVVLLITGVSLTLYLPDYKPSDVQAPTTPKINYQINQDSLKQPINMSDILLKPPIPPESIFGVRLGLYSQLQQAIDASSGFNTKHDLTIIKAQDNYRQWYLVITGPFDSHTQSTQIQQQLSVNKISATLIQWPLAIEDSK